MFPAVCGDGFEAARADGEGAAGGDAAVYTAGCPEGAALADQTEGLRAGEEENLYYFLFLWRSKEIKLQI